MQQQCSNLLLCTLFLAAPTHLGSAGVFASGKDQVISRHLILPDAPAPSPAATLRGCLISFTIDNYDHKDLARTICSNETTMHRAKLANTSKIAEKSIKRHRNATNETDNLLVDVMDKVGDAVGEFGESIGMEEAGDAIEESIDDMVNSSDVGFVLVQGRGQSKVQGLMPMAPAPAAAAGPAPAPGPQPLVVVCETVQTVLRRTIESTVQHLLVLPLGQGPAPAPVMLQAPPRQLRGSGAIPASLSPESDAPPSPEVDVFIRFRPGEEKENANGTVAGRNIKVDVTLYGQPSNMIHDMKVLEPNLVLTAAAESGVFEKVLDKALFEVTRVKPKIRSLKIEEKQIEQWSVEKCQAHFSHIVKRFSVAYTRGMVPHALYNECTNFMTRLTFSDDLVVDDLDRNACRQATLEFGKRWKFGARKSHELSLEGEFNGFCQTACELKYGGEHPKCHVTEGKELVSNP